MLTKLRTTPGYYDVVLINSAFTGQAQSEGLISAVDSNKIENFNDLSPGMGGNPNLVMNDKVYGVAWVWGVTSFAVDSTRFSNIPDSIEVLWDKKYAGKVSVRDDAVEAVQLTAIALGQDINNPSDLNAIKNKLMSLKSQVRTYWSSEDEWNQFFTADEFDLATYWSGSASRSKTAFKLPVEFVIPKEGAIGWLDGLSVATNAPNSSGAHKFIDWMIDPDFYVKWDTEVGAPASANAKANSMLPSSAFNRAILGNSQKVSKVQFMGPMDDKIREEILEIWQEVKASQ
jgi:spermidine/putrescine transport system substrate-binding protein